MIATSGVTLLNTGAPERLSSSSRTFSDKCPSSSSARTSGIPVARWRRSAARVSGTPTAPDARRRRPNSTDTRPGYHSGFGPCARSARWAKRRRSPSARELKDHLGGAHQPELVAGDTLDGDRILAKVLNAPAQVLNLLAQLTVLGLDLREFFGE